MALSLQQVRDSIMTSIYGRRLGLDKDDRLCGIKGRRETITAATSDTTGTNLPNYGIITVATSTDDTWILDDPETGCEVKIMTGTTSTGDHYIIADNATIKSSLGLDQTTIDLRGGGAGCTLVGLSTSQWGVLTKSSTTAIIIS